jgi:hypothetical protein
LHDYHGLGSAAEKWQSAGMSPRTRHYSRTGFVLSIVLAHTASVHAVEHETSAQGSSAQVQTDGASDAELLGLLEGLTHPPPSTPKARAAAARSVAKLLAGGRSDAVTERALDALSALAAADSAPLLVNFAQHRRPSVRVRALTALSRVAGTDRALRQVVADGLRDSAPEVRAAAARGLTTLRASEASPLLLRAFARGVPEAAATLGEIGDPSSLAGFSAQLTKQPLDAMLAGYAGYLARKDLPDAAKLEVVAQLEELSGPAVLRFLSRVSLDPRSSPALKQASLRASARIAKAVQRAAAGGRP